MAKKGKNAPSIDIKQFLLDKGERIVLVLALAFMGLLVTFGFIVNGLGAGSASANADELARMRKQDQDAFTRSSPPPTLKDIDPELLSAGVLNPLEPDAYVLKKPYFTPLLADDNKWRLPAVLGPDEFQVDLVRGVVKTYIFNRDGTMVKYLVPRKNKNQPNAGAINPLTGGRGGPMMGGGGGAGRRLGGAGGRGFGGGMMGNPEDAAASGVGDAMDSGGGDMVYQDVPVARIEKGDWAENGKRAERIVPVRMAMIQGAFPLKNQMEEFRRALRFQTTIQMEDEITPEFSGLKVERRQYDLNGKLLSKTWEPVDLFKELVPFLVFDSEPEDQQMMAYGLIWPRDRLVVPRPALARDQTYPEPKLKGIQATIEEIKQQMQGAPLPPTQWKTRFSKNPTDFDAFENSGMDSTMGEEGGMMRGEPMRGRGGDADAMGARGDRRGGMPLRGSMPPGSGMAPGAGVAGRGIGAGSMPPGAMAAAGIRPGTMPGVPGGMQGMLNTQQLYPEKVLVRFTDPSVKPGFMYEYQVTIRMKNPLYKKEDKAMIKTQTIAEEILSQPVVISQKLVVPHEFNYYFVTENAQRARAMSVNGATPVQIHRWLDTTPNDLHNGVRIPVGDWSIAEQVPAYRGEFIGRIENQEVPTWFPLQESFMFASRPDARTKRRLKGIPVDFNTGNILVDYQGGALQRYTRKDGSGVEDSSEVDALVLTRDGRLVLRNSQDDTDDKDRKERLNAWRDWIKEVRDKKDEGYRPQMQQVLMEGRRGS
jgi:hypothetical protein